MAQPEFPTVCLSAGGWWYLGNTDTFEAISNVHQQSRQMARTCGLVTAGAGRQAETAQSWLLKPELGEEVWCLPGHDDGSGIAIAADVLERCGLAAAGSVAVLPWTRRE